MEAGFSKNFGPIKSVNPPFQKTKIVLPPFSRTKKIVCPSISNSRKSPCPPRISYSKKVLWPLFEVCLILPFCSFMFFQVRICLSTSPLPAKYGSSMFFHVLPCSLTLSPTPSDMVLSYSSMFVHLPSLTQICTSRFVHVRLSSSMFVHVRPF